MHMGGVWEVYGRCFRVPDGSVLRCVWGGVWECFRVPMGGV